MPDTHERVSIGQLILWPSVITLAVTVLRLVGELQHWSPRFFSREAGGGGALVGISWLPFIFGIYFAVKLCGSGDSPSSIGRAILVPLLGFGVIVIAAVLVSVFLKNSPFLGALPVMSVASLIAIVLQRSAWPGMFKTLLAYAFAARIPVALIMLVAIYGNWGTHYDVPPTPDFPAMNWFAKWVLIGALPQFFLWIAYTLIVGGLVAGITAAIVRRRSTSQQPAAA
jgi:hypothetical protein